MEKPTVTVTSDRESWDAFVAAAPEATAYHRYDWKEVIEKSFGHRSHYLAAVDRTGAIEGVLPLIHMASRLWGNFLVSVPFVNYGGVLAASEAAAQALLAASERLRHFAGARHVELRHVGREVVQLPTRRHKVTMILPLAGDEERQWAAFNAKLRNQIRKAQKNGLECVTGHLELLDSFYGIFARNMRDLGTPVYAKEFFRNVLATFPESTRIFTVRYRGSAIASGIALWFRDTVEVPWASSIVTYRPLCPNDLLYWETIRFAIGKGFKSFDFGRSTPNEGTYHFKKQWGAEPVPLCWQYLLREGGSFPGLSPSNPKFSLAIRLWKRLPLPVANLIGPRLVRNIP